ANVGERKREVAQSLRAANAQLALDALSIERWAREQTSRPEVRGVYAGGTSAARSESATAQANKLRDLAAGKFPKTAPSLVVFVDEQGVALGRNGSALMRGDQLGSVYPSLAESLKTGVTASAVWLNRERQEQLFASYAPVLSESGAVLGAVVIGTPLNDERLARVSELTSGHALLLGAPTQAGKVEIIANSGRTTPGVMAAANTQAADRAAERALATSSVTAADEPASGHVLGATPLEGYSGTRAVLVGAVPASPVGGIAGLLWPVLGVTALGRFLVAIAGWLLGNYFGRPIEELGDGLLSVINGNIGHRFQVEHPDLGGLVFRINSLLNALMGVPEDTTDEEGRPSQAPAANNFQDALAVDESSVAGQAVDPAVAAALAAEPSDQYYRRVFDEYLRAKRKLGDPVDHIGYDAFVERIRGSEQQLSQKHGRPVRYQVQLRDDAVVLIAVPLSVP